MDLGTDGMQPHVQGSPNSADLFKRTRAGPLGSGLQVCNENQARVGHEVQMLQANLSPANPGMMQRHNCMQ